MMLVSKNKDKKKKTQKDLETSEDHIESMRNWVRKIEQSTMSVSSRLAAVEKRLSGRSVNGSDNPLSEGLLEGPIERIFSTLRDEKKKKGVEEVSKLLDAEFSVMQDQIILQDSELTALKEQLTTINSSIVEVKNQLKNLQVIESQLTTDLTTRVTKIEAHEPPTVKLGKLEVPIEITGIIGGIIAFVFAALVAFNQKDIILSPLFLVVIGLILIGSALFKTISISSGLGKLVKKTNSTPNTTQNIPEEQL